MKSKQNLLLPFLKKEGCVCSEAQLQEFAQALASELKGGDCVFLEGSLGAGKSTLARFILKALGVERPPEGSPTFAIIHQYTTPKLLSVAHADFYRLNSLEEIELTGIDAVAGQPDVLFICEWASRFPEWGWRREDDWRVELGFVPDREDLRTVRLDNAAFRRMGEALR